MSLTEEISIYSLISILDKKFKNINDNLEFQNISEIIMEMEPIMGECKTIDDFYETVDHKIKSLDSNVQQEGLNDLMRYLPSYRFINYRDETGKLRIKLKNITEYLF